MSERIPGLRPTDEPTDEINGNLRPVGANELADHIRGAIGAAPFEEVSVYAPPHRSRGDGMEASYMPLTVEEFDALRDLPRSELERIGLRSWDGSLMLFPHEWFPLIPSGFEVVDIFGNTEAFDPATADDDCRFGVLSFGIIPHGNEQEADDA